MAEDSDQERQESATPKRQREARERGQVPRSRELTMTLLLLSAGAALLALGPSLANRLLQSIRDGLSVPRARLFDSAAMTQSLVESGAAALAALMPLLAVLIAVAALAPLTFGGWTFSAQAIGFKWDRVSPFAGLKRMVSARGWIELFKALAKFTLLAFVTYWLMGRQAPRLLKLGVTPLPEALADVADLLVWSFLTLCGALVAIAAIDVPLQRLQYDRQLRMTRQEVRDEFKEIEGKPEIRAQIRKLQRRMAQQRMMSEVPKASVILTNPTHVAVALRYDPERMRAPRVVAKGAELVAANIRRVGAEHNVPIVESPPLARALYRGADLNDEIPVGLYAAVAQVLAYVVQLRAAGATAQDLGPPPYVDVPPEFRSD